MSSKSKIYHLRFGDRRFPLFRIRKNGELIIFPPFEKLWSLLAFTGQFQNWFFCGRQTSFFLPPNATSSLTGTKFPNSDFMTFMLNNTDGPITTDGIRLATFSNSTQLLIRWSFRSPVIAPRSPLFNCDNQCVTIGFFSTDVVNPQDQNRMYALYGKDEIAIFNRTSGQFISPTINQLFVNVPTDTDLILDLTVSVVIPYKENTPCLVQGVPFVKYISICDGCEKIKIPVFSLLLGANNLVTKTPFPWFELIASEINRVFQLTSLSLLLPIIPQPVPPPITFENVPLGEIGLTLDLLTFSTITDSFGPDIFIDAWFGHYWSFKLFSTSVMIPLITFQFRVQAGPGTIGAFYTAKVNLQYMYAGSLWAVHEQVNEMGQDIGPASMTYNNILPNSVSLLNGSFRLKSDSIDVDLSAIFTLMNSPTPGPSLNVALLTLNITYVPVIMA